MYMTHDEQKKVKSWNLTVVDFCVAIWNQIINFGRTSKSKEAAE